MRPGAVDLGGGRAGVLGGDHDRAEEAPVALQPVLDEPLVVRPGQGHRVVEVAPGGDHRDLLVTDHGAGDAVGVEPVPQHGLRVAPRRTVWPRGSVRMGPLEGQVEGGLDAGHAAPRGQPVVPHPGEVRGQLGGVAPGDAHVAVDQRRGRRPGPGRRRSEARRRRRRHRRAGLIPRPAGWRARARPAWWRTARGRCRGRCVASSPRGSAGGSAANGSSEIPVRVVAGEEDDPVGAGQLPGGDQVLHRGGSSIGWLDRRM